MDGHRNIFVPLLDGKKRGPATHKKLAVLRRAPNRAEPESRGTRTKSESDRDACSHLKTAGRGLGEVEISENDVPGAEVRLVEDEVADAVIPAPDGVHHGGRRRLRGPATAFSQQQRRRGDGPSAVAVFVE